MGQYLFHYKVISFKVFEIPYSKSILTIGLVIIAGLLENLQKKLERKNLINDD
ncbi:hypothetical protein [Macrococcus animalis]|uniref:hypothetical protein n=1 Tax=Macrococcus animalis TaxID=3395467 RepID=UPI0039BE6FA9